MTVSGHSVNASKDWRHLPVFSPTFTPGTNLPVGAHCHDAVVASIARHRAICVHVFFLCASSSVCSHCVVRNVAITLNRSATHELLMQC